MKTILLAIAGFLSLTYAAPAASPDNGASYHGENVADLLVSYGKLTGKKILYDQTVQGQVGIVGSPTENVDRQIELIEKALFLNGFALIDAGDDVVEVLGLGKPARMVGLPLYTKPDEMPGGQRVFSYLVKLEHRDALEMAGVLSQYTPPSTTTAFTSDRGSRTLIVTGQTSVVRNVLKLVAALDVPETPDAKPALPPPPIKRVGGND